MIVAQITAEKHDNIKFICIVQQQYRLRSKTATTTKGWYTNSTNMRCASDEHKFLAHHSIAVFTQNNKGRQDKNMPANIIA